MQNHNKYKLNLLKGTELSQTYTGYSKNTELLNYYFIDSTTQFVLKVDRAQSVKSSSYIQTSALGKCFAVEERLSGTIDM